jgi:hypothetical protein
MAATGSVDTGPDEPTRERAPDDRLSDIRGFDPAARSQLFLNHSWLFWLPWGSGLTIPNQQRRERFNGATPFLPHGSTP